MLTRAERAKNGIFSLQRRRKTRAFSPFDPEEGNLPKRPEIEKQENEGQCDHHRLGHQPERKEEKGKGVALPLPLPGVARVGKHGGQPEKRAQYILSLGHPGNRFDMERMNRKQSGRNGAPPDRPGQISKQQEKEKSVCDMQEQVVPVVARRANPVQLHIKHVGDPGDRMPVEGMGRSECPGHIPNPQS